jgi:hypothetical protein
MTQNKMVQPYYWKTARREEVGNKPKTKDWEEIRGWRPFVN